MRLSEAENICSDHLDVINDCSFDSLYLVGKKIEKNRSYISFIGSLKYIENFLTYDMCGAICTEEVARVLKDKFRGGIAISENPKKAFFEIHNYLGNCNFKNKKTYIDPTARICASAIIADTGVCIGENVIISHNAVIKEGTYIGDDSIIREGCVIGTPAFYYYGEGNERKLVDSTGTVRIGKNVELHANVVVEKGVMYGETVIDDNTKIDNMTLIGHDSQIGKNCTIAGGTTVAGGVCFEDGAFAGVGVEIAPNVCIGQKAILSTGAAVTKDVESNQHVSGNFAVPHDLYIQHIKGISK